MVWRVRPVAGERRPVGLAFRTNAGLWAISYPRVAEFTLTDDNPQWDAWEYAPVEET
jgi:hypothetical protein